MGILPTKTSVHLPYCHAACHCWILSTVHHLKQVQFLWNPSCAVKTKQLYYSYLHLPPLWYDFAFLGFFTSLLTVIYIRHPSLPVFCHWMLLTLSFSNHSLLCICVTTKLYAVESVVSHVTNMASDSAQCEVPILRAGTSLHRGEGNTKCE